MKEQDKFHACLVGHAMEIGTPYIFVSVGKDKGNILVATFSVLFRQADGNFADSIHRMLPFYQRDNPDADGPTGDVVDFLRNHAINRARNEILLAENAYSLNKKARINSQIGELQKRDWKEMLTRVRLFGFPEQELQSMLELTKSAEFANALKEVIKSHKADPAPSFD